MYTNRSAQLFWRDTNETLSLGFENNGGSIRIGWQTWFSQKNGRKIHWVSGSFGATVTVSFAVFRGHKSFSRTDIFLWNLATGYTAVVRWELGALWEPPLIFFPCMTLWCDPYNLQKTHSKWNAWLPFCQFISFRRLWSEACSRTCIEVYCAIMLSILPENLAGLLRHKKIITVSILSQKNLVVWVPTQGSSQRGVTAECLSLSPEAPGWNLARAI